MYAVRYLIPILKKQCISATHITKTIRQPIYHSSCFTKRFFNVSSAGLNKYNSKTDMDFDDDFKGPNLKSPRRVRHYGGEEDGDSWNSPRKSRSSHRSFDFDDRDSRTNPKRFSQRSYENENDWNDSFKQRGNFQNRFQRNDEQGYFSKDRMKSSNNWFDEPLEFKRTTASFSTNAKIGGYVPRNVWEKKGEMPALKEVESKDMFKIYPNTSVEFASVPSKDLIDRIQKTLPEKFSDIPNVHPKLLANIHYSGKMQMTPVQRYASVLFDEVDLLASAETGSGKTVAFLFPILHHLLNNYPQDAMEELGKNRKSYPSGLIMAPTRELVQQIYSVARELTGGTPIKPVVFYGGSKISDQINEIERGGCHLAIGTPGRLTDLLKSGILSLKACRYVVLDEADRMLDMGFEPQIRNILNNKEYGMPNANDRFSTSLFSATFPPEVRRLAKAFVNGSSSKMVHFTIKHSETDDNNLPTHIQHDFINVDDLRGCAEIACRTVIDDLKASNEARILIFCNMKRVADTLENMMYRQGISVSVIHGDKSQSLREKALRDFRNGESQVLIASDVMARGIDIPNVNKVINFEIPKTAEAYIHRSGRTGRMGRDGHCLTLVTGNDLRSSTLKEIVHMMKESNRPLPRFLDRI